MGNDAGSTRGPGAVRLTGWAEQYGAPGRFEAVLMTDGRFFWTIGGPLGETVLFDGTSVVIRDANGTRAQATGRDRAPARFLGHALGAPWVGGRVAGQLTFDDTVASAGVTDAGDVRTITRHSIEGAEEIRASGRHERFGLVVPSTVDVRVADAVRTRLRIETVEPWRGDGLPQVAETGGPLRVTVRSDRTATIPVRRVPNGQLLVQCAWGTEVGWWIFDTGASMAVIDRETARGRGLVPIGRWMVTSMFGQEPGSLYRIDGLEIGPVAIDQLVVSEMDLEPLSEAFGERLVGIIGYELLSRAVIELDPGPTTLGFVDPSVVPNDVSWTPLRLVDRLPVVDGVVEGRVSGGFRLDTGAGPALMLNQWVQETTDVLAGRASEAIDGQPIEGRVGTVAGFELAGHAVSEVQTIFVTGGSGPIAALLNDRDLVGNVGAGVLGQFRLVFDYPRRRMALVPRRQT